MQIVVGTRGTSGVPEFGGSTWVRLQYMLGLKKLGYEPYWVDRLFGWDAYSKFRSLEYNIATFHNLAERYGFADRYCIVYNNGEEYYGMNRDQYVDLTSTAEALINVSGHLPEASLLNKIDRRAYLDLDPGFTQIWNLEMDMAIERHNFHFTVGQNVSSEDFFIPKGGINWISFVPPVCLDLWTPLMDERCNSFTTIADWRASQNAVFNDDFYENKRPEFLKIIELPRNTAQDIELALLIGPGDHADIETFFENGWNLLDPYRYTSTPELYSDFIRFSRAEFSVAKHGYVKSNSGWISDRTACYLASGKPALIQSTGFESTIPTGKGLLTFSDMAEACDGIRAINSEYDVHCRAARGLAEEYFDSSIVLRRMLRLMGL